MSKTHDIILEKDLNDKIIIVNIKELQNLKRLEGAHVFKILFKLIKNERFGEFL